MAITHSPAAVAPFGAITIHRVITALWALAERLQDWNDSRRTTAALRRLNAAALKDIGLTRAEVDDFGRKGL